jgi:uncharacterized repeat protein (TIGR01451 family)
MTTTGRSESNSPASPARGGGASGPARERHSPWSRVRKNVFVAGVAALLIGGTSVSAALTTTESASAAGVSCPPVPIWVNTATDLLSYDSVTGTQLSSAPLSRAYGDIAWSADGKQLYGINWDEGAYLPPVLYTIDSASGAEIAALPLAGAAPAQPAPGYAFNALTAIDPSTLLVGSNAAGTIYAIDIATGASTTYAQFPDGLVSSGDFAVLPGGDILALATDNTNGTVVFRIHPDHSVTEIGTVADFAFGAALSGDHIFLAGSAGTLLSIPLSSLPTSGTAPLTTSTLTAAVPAPYGASAQQDAGTCNVPTLTKTASPSTVSQVGETITYTFVITNVSDVDLRAASVTDTQAAPAGQLTSPPQCPSTTIPAHGSLTCTATYTVTQADLDHGRIDDTAIATALTPNGDPVQTGTATATVFVTAVASAPGPLHTPAAAAPQLAATGSTTNSAPLGVAIAFLVLGGFAVVARRFFTKRLP